MANNNPLSQELFEFHASTPQKKSDPKYGAMVAKKLLSTITSGTNNYYAKRNRKFKQLRALAQGNVEMKEFLDLLNIDGKSAYVNIDMTPPKILPKFMDIVVERFMEMEERPTAEAVDDRSKEQRQKDMDEAEFAMNNSMLIQGLEEEAGMPILDPNKYVPENYEDFHLHFDYEYKQPEEMNFQRKITDTMNDSDNETIKRAVLYDLVEVGLGVMFVYRDEHGKKKYKRVIPENSVYGWSNSDNINSSITGEIEKMKVSDIRVMWPNISEKALFAMWKKTEQASTVSLEWNDSLSTMFIRPYDDALIEIFHFQLETTKPHMWVEKTDNYGKTLFEEKQERPQRLGEGKVLHERSLKVIYKGVFSKTTDEILEWKLMEDMIKPHYALHEVFNSYVLFMPNNREMNNVSLAERAVTPVRMMTIALLKMQQIMAKLRPDGIAIDVRGLHGVQTGLGENDYAEPMELVKIYDQTGNLLYNGVDEDGETRKSTPIVPMATDSNVQKLQALVDQYNHWLQRLRDDLGINEYVEGQAVNPKLGLGVMQNQVAASNRSTNFIYRAYLTMMKEVAKRIAIMDWYDTVEEGDHRYGIQPGELADKVFDINFDMAPTDQDRAYIEQMAGTALSAGLITFEESVKVRRIAKQDVKLAEIYLGKYEAKRKRELRDETAQNTRMQGQIADQSSQNKANQDVQVAKMKGMIEAEKQKAVNVGTNTQVMGTIVNTVIGELLKQGKSLSDVPPEFQGLFQTFFQNMGGNQQLQTMQTQVQAQDLQQQAMAEQQQQQAEQQQQQPQQ